MAKEDLEKINLTKNDTGVNEGAAAAEIQRGKRTRKNLTPVSKQEAEARKSALKTQGVKGVKAERITMAFSPDNHRFIKVISAITGMSMTEVCNNIIDQYRADHADMVKKANEVYAEFTKGF